MFRFIKVLIISKIHAKVILFFNFCLKAGFKGESEILIFSLFLVEVNSSM